MRWPTTDTTFTRVTLRMVSLIYTLFGIPQEKLTVFLRNLHRRQAPNFRISQACSRCALLNGPFLRPTRFSESFFVICDALLTTALDAFAVGFFRAPLRDVGDTGAPCDELGFRIAIGFTNEVVGAARGLGRSS